MLEEIKNIHSEILSLYYYETWKAKLLIKPKSSRAQLCEIKSVNFFLFNCLWVSTMSYPFCSPRKEGTPPKRYFTKLQRYLSTNAPLWLTDPMRRFQQPRQARQSSYIHFHSKRTTTTLESLSWKYFECSYIKSDSKKVGDQKTMLEILDSI